jgi:cytochrome c oxidase subunit 4
VSQQHVVPVRTNLIVFAALLTLLLVAIGVAYLDLGPGVNTVVTMLIATCKAVLILLFFMHVRFSNRLVWVFSGAAFLWLGILIALTLNDYLTRGWLVMADK